MKHSRDTGTQTGTQTGPQTGMATSHDKQDRELPDLLSEAGIRPGRGIDDWLDWLTKRGQATQ